MYAYSKEIKLKITTVILVFQKNSKIQYERCIRAILLYVYYNSVYKHKHNTSLNSFLESLQDCTLYVLQS